MIFRLLFSILLFLPLAVLEARDLEEDLECNQCRKNLHPYPETGLWFDREEPGTGFMFEVQNGILAGYWFGYDESGQPAWFLISGALEARGETKRGWTLETDLERFEGGNCIGCEFSPPDDPEIAGTIELEFRTRTNGRFRVGGGAWHDLNSFAYGVKMREVFSVTDDPVPDPEGLWTIVYQNREAEVTAGQQWAIGSVEVKISSLFLPEEDRLVGGFSQASGIEQIPVGSYECSQARSSQVGVCKIEVGRGAGLRAGKSNAADKKFLMPVANLSDSYFYARSPEGDTLEGFRISYD